MKLSLSTSLSGFTKSAVPFGGALDTLIAQGATVARAYSHRRLLTSYTGAANLLRGNGSGSPVANIDYLPNGDYDLTAAEALRVAGGGTQAFCNVWYDQSGGGNYAEQTDTSLQPPFTTSIVSKGAIGGVASTGCYLSFMGDIPQPFFIYVIVSVGALSSTRYILGQTTAALDFLRSTSSLTLGSNRGITLQVANGAAGAKSLANLVNGASSALYKNGSLIFSGNNGPNSLQYSRIGSGATVPSSWFTEAGSTISELIIFSSDPTGLAGWSAFETTARAYYA